MAAHVAKSDRQFKEASRQLHRMVDHNKDYDALLSEWKEQQHRTDAVLDKWERIGATLEAKHRLEPAPSRAHN